MTIQKEEKKEPERNMFDDWRLFAVLVIFVGMIIIAGSINYFADMTYKAGLTQEERAEIQHQKDVKAQQDAENSKKFWDSFSNELNVPVPLWFLIVMVVIAIIFKPRRSWWY